MHKIRLFWCWIDAFTYRHFVCNLPGCVLRNARLCAGRLGCVEGHPCLGASCCLTARHQAITWTNADLSLNHTGFTLFSIALSRTNFSSNFQENAFENVICKLSSILLRPQWVKGFMWSFDPYYSGLLYWLYFPASEVTLKNMGKIWLVSQQQLNTLWTMCIILGMYCVQSGTDVTIVQLTHCGQVMPYGDIDLGQHWLR